MIAATGYRPDLGRLTFLDEDCGPGCGPWPAPPWWTATTRPAHPGSSWSAPGWRPPSARSCGSCTARTTRPGAVGRRLAGAATRRAARGRGGPAERAPRAMPAAPGRRGRAASPRQPGIAAAPAGRPGGPRQAGPPPGRSRRQWRCRWPTWRRSACPRRGSPGTGSPRLAGGVRRAGVHGAVRRRAAPAADLPAGRRPGRADHRGGGAAGCGTAALARCGQALRLGAGAAALLIAARVAVSAALRAAHRRGRLTERALLAGDGPEARRTGPPAGGSSRAGAAPGRRAG